MNSCQPGREFRNFYLFQNGVSCNPEKLRFRSNEVEKVLSRTEKGYFYQAGILHTLDGGLVKSFEPGKVNCAYVVVPPHDPFVCSNYQESFNSIMKKRCTSAPMPPETPSATSCSTRATDIRSRESPENKLGCCEPRARPRVTSFEPKLSTQFESKQRSSERCDTPQPRSSRPEPKPRSTFATNSKASCDDVKSKNGCSDTRSKASCSDSSQRRKCSDRESNQGCNSKSKSSINASCESKSRSSCPPKASTRCGDAKSKTSCSESDCGDKSSRRGCSPKPKPKSSCEQLACCDTKPRPETPRTPPHKHCVTKDKYPCCDQDSDGEGDVDVKDSKQPLSCKPSPVRLPAPKRKSNFWTKCCPCCVKKRPVSACNPRPSSRHDPKNTKRTQTLKEDFEFARKCMKAAMELQKKRYKMYGKNRKAQTKADALLACADPSCNDSCESEEAKQKREEEYRIARDKYRSKRKKLEAQISKALEKEEKRRSKRGTGCS